jgi:hypothetical protein
VLRDSAAEADLRVVVLGLLGAPERRVLGRRRGRRAEPKPDAAPVTTTRATLIRGQRATEDEARAWLAEPAAPVDEELAVLNRVVHLHRVSAADPFAREVRREQALVVRVGYGRGEEVADGLWTEAVEPPAPRAPRRRGREAALRPQERLAALLGGRDAALACEELALRARGDLDGSRPREAALQVRVALEAAIAELEAWRERGDLAERIETLKTHRAGVGEAANAALRGGLDASASDAVARALQAIEAALRARTAGGFLR